MKLALAFALLGPAAVARLLVPGVVQYGSFPTQEARLERVGDALARLDRQFRRAGDAWELTTKADEFDGKVAVVAVLKERSIFDLNADLAALAEPDPNSITDDLVRLDVAALLQARGWIDSRLRNPKLRITKDENTGEWLYDVVGLVQNEGRGWLKRTFTGRKLMPAERQIIAYASVHKYKDDLNSILRAAVLGFEAMGALNGPYFARKMQEATSIAMVCKDGEYLRVAIAHSKPVQESTSEEIAIRFDDEVPEMISAVTREDYFWLTDEEKFNKETGNHDGAKLARRLMEHSKFRLRHADEGITLVFEYDRDNAKEVIGDLFRRCGIAIASEQPADEEAEKRRAQHALAHLMDLQERYWRLQETATRHTERELLKVIPPEYMARVLDEIETERQMMASGRLTQGQVDHRNAARATLYKLDFPSPWFEGTTMFITIKKPPREDDCASVYSDLALVRTLGITERVLVYEKSNEIVRCQYSESKPQ